MTTDNLYFAGFFFLDSRRDIDVIIEILSVNPLGLLYGEGIDLLMQLLVR
jgi:hypothetical protein